MQVSIKRVDYSRCFNIDYFDHFAECPSRYGNLTLLLSFTRMIIGNDIFIYFRMHNGEHHVVAFASESEAKSAYTGRRVWHGRIELRRLGMISEASANAITIKNASLCTS